MLCYVIYLTFFFYVKSFTGCVHLAVKQPKSSLHICESGILIRSSQAHCEEYRMQSIGQYRMQSAQCNAGQSRCLLENWI